MPGGPLCIGSRSGPGGLLKRGVEHFFQLDISVSTSKGTGNDTASVLQPQQQQTRKTGSKALPALPRTRTFISHLLHGNIDRRRFRNSAMQGPGQGTRVTHVGRVSHQPSDYTHTVQHRGKRRWTQASEMPPNETGEKAHTGDLHACSQDRRGPSASPSRPNGCPSATTLDWAMPTKQRNRRRNSQDRCVLSSPQSRGNTMSTTTGATGIQMISSDRPVPQNSQRV